ncbi:hypothetical protein IL306_012300 [Fusarium sp. DS 682]|nr:hypothetical protein IL306_012300 [Fusarium sp. DS 682]
MNDSNAKVAKQARDPTATSPAPRNKLTEDIIVNLGPATVVDALNTATGTLRASLDNASSNERDFINRTALASYTIWGWFDELESWPWPSESSSAGFLMPNDGERKRISMQLTVPGDGSDQWMGSLLARDVSKYEQRLAQIQRDLLNLGLEDIKIHVLNHHILPLSRPGTPLAEFTGAGQLSRSSYNRMEDHTAVITAIVLKALPVLGKLTRLLHTWNLRLCALRRVPTVLLALEDAEVALKSAFKAISIPTKDTPKKDDNTPSQDSTLTRNTFDVMKGHLGELIVRPGRSLDYMLDCLEGLPDTLPIEWLDRMEAVESSYGEWVVVCERKIRHTERTAPPEPSQPPRSPSPVKQNTEADKSATLVDNLVGDESDNDYVSSVNAGAGVEPIPLLLPPKKVKTTGPSNSAMEPTKARVPSGVSESETVVPEWYRRDPSSESEPESPSFLPIDEVDESYEDANDTFDGTKDIVPVQSQVLTPSIEQDFNSSTMSTQYPETPDHSFTNHFDRDISPELPPLRPLPLPRQKSDPSRTLTVTQRSSSYFGGLSSDPPEASTSPDIPRTRIRETEYTRASPPSTPPMLPADSRESSLAPLDSPLLPDRNIDDLDMSNMRIEDSFNEDFDDSFSIAEYSTSFDRRNSVGDQHLQQQISQIIDSIPAKIKLTNDSSSRVNLNPPDIQLPRMRKRPSIEPFRRSTSNLSSRAGTPSFTLSPAKNTRVRNRGHHEIKVYHLSRSTGEAPIKLFIRCVGEQGERVMVRVGGGWADLGEYLKEYASHHKRRSAAANAKVEVLPESPGASRSNMGSSPNGRPQSAVELSPMSPLAVRKTRRSVGAMGSEAPSLNSKTYAFGPALGEEDHSEVFNRSRSNSRLSWNEDESSFLGLAGPTGKKVEMSEENKAWVASVKEKVRIASGERSRLPSTSSQFGELGRVGGTKRLFLKSEDRRESKGGRESRGSVR